MGLKRERQRIKERVGKRGIKLEGEYEGKGEWEREEEQTNE